MNLSLQHVLGSGELNSTLWLFFSLLLLTFFFAQISSIKAYTYSFPSHSFHFQEIVYDYESFYKIFFNNRIFLRANVGLCDL